MEKKIDALNTLVGFLFIWCLLSNGLLIYWIWYDHSVFLNMTH